MAAAGAAPEDRRLVIDQLIDGAGENGWPIGQARSVLLIAPGGESSDMAALWSDATADRCATIASGIGEPQTGSDFGDEGGRGRKSV